MSKKMYFKDEALKRLQSGVDAIANAVKVTLGPRGRNVTMSKHFGSPQITKDGVSVAREVEFDDMRSLGAESMKAASIKTAEEAGDGTTSSMVMAQAIFSEARRAIAGGIHPVFLKRGLDEALKHSLGFVQDFSVPVDSLDEITKVAALAGNGDQALGELIAEAMEMVGKDGVISVEENHSLETYLEFSEGMQLDRGYLSPDFILDPEATSITLDNPLVLLADERLKTDQDILPALELAVNTNRPLMIIAHDLEDTAFQTCLMNHLNRKITVCMAKAPRIGEKRTQILENLATLCGAEVVSPQTGNTLQNRQASDMLGGSDSITITKDTTTLVGGAGESDVVEAKIRELRSRAQTAGSEHDKEFYQQQMSQLSGGIAVIRVGAATELELKEYKSRVEDSLSATQAAVRGGIVPGGGSILLQVADYLSFLLEDDDTDLGLESMDERKGFETLIKALEKPFYQIMKNAGIEPNGAIYRYKEAIKNGSAPNLIMDARTGEIRDALEAGVIDPTLVVEQVLRNSVSVASTLATASCLVVNSDTEDLEEDNDSNQ